MQQTIDQPIGLAPDGKRPIGRARISRGWGLRWLAAGLLVTVTLFLYRVLWAAPAAAGVSDLIFSEYVDSFGFDKALELYNGTGSAVDLSAYRIELYSDGNGGAPNFTLSLSGVLADGSTLIVVHPFASASLQAAAAILSPVVQFDGNDALLLRRGSAVVDSFGRVGENPGAEWSSGGVGTRQVTLRRRAAVCSGRTAYTDVFNPAAEWERWPLGTLTGLGAHSSDCGGALASGLPVINEFVQNHVGTNTQEFIEVFGNPNFNYSDFSVVVVSGDAPNQGVISRIYQVGVTNPQGYWRTPFRNQELSNGANSYLLVQGLTAPPGADLDVNDDGVLDQYPWAALVDDVAVSTGFGNARTYSSSTLLPNFDGTNTMVGGASRIPDATDTNRVADWRRNHFNGQGLGCTVCSGVAAAHEAVNTPSLRNLPGAGAPPPTSTFTPTPSASVTIVIPPIATIPTITPVPPFISPTPQPPPVSGCFDYVVNGGFESTGYWTFGESPSTARFAGEQRGSGLRSMLLGNMPGPQPDVKSYSSVRQLVSIPAGASMAFLRYSHFSQSQEPAVEVAGRHEDRQEVILLASNLQTLEILSRVRRNNAGWAVEQLDLTRLIGREFYLYFNVFNDGNNARTWMYLDDVVLGVCYPPATMTPVAPTSAPISTFGPTITMSPTPTPSSTTPAPTAALLGPEDKGGAAGIGAVGADETAAAIVLSPITPTPPVPTSLAAGAPPLTIEPQPGTPGPSALPNCVELVDNGGFEAPSASWRTEAQGGVAEYTGDVFFEGSQSMRLGNIGSPGGTFKATVEQNIDPPEGYGRVILSFRYFPLLEGTPGAGAIQFASVYYTQTGQIARLLLAAQRNDRQWLHSQHDLTALGSQPLRLVLGAQSSDDRGTLGMYVDNVSVLACDSGATITSQGGVGAADGGIVGAAEGGVEISGDLLTEPKAPLAGEEAAPAAPARGPAFDLSGLLGGIGGQLGPLAIIVGILALVILAWLLSGFFVRGGRPLMILLFFALVVLVFVWLSRGF